MKVARFENPFDIKIRQYQTPTIRDDDLLINVAYCGICGTDIHIYEGQVPFVTFPIIPGHEFSGTIKAMGANVTDFAIGEKVAINPNLSCKDHGYSFDEYCYYCKKNRPHFCINWEAIGVTRNGGFSEFVVCPSTSAFKVPQNVSLTEAAFMEPIACCLHGLQQVNIGSRNTVLVIGAGPIGLLMVSLIKSLYRSKIIVSEPHHSRRKLAARLGADITVDPKDEILKEVINGETKNYGVDVSIEAVGSTTTSLEAIKCLNKGGKALLFGVSKPEDTIKLNLFELYSKELSVYGTFTNPHENDKALEMLDNKSIKVSALISHILSIDKLEEGLKLIKNKTQDVKKILIRIEE
ncbi:MAG: zinc-dependent alcohol dehydrogenase family protein [Candidatus Hodarchaeota archaeon]